MNPLKRIQRNLKFVQQKSIPHNRFAKVTDLFAGKRKKYYIFNLNKSERHLINTLRLLKTLVEYKNRLLILGELSHIPPLQNKNISEYRTEWSPGLFLRALNNPKKEKLFEFPNILLTFSDNDDNLIAVKEATKLNILNFVFTQLDKEIYYHSDFAIPVNHTVASHSRIFYTLILSKILFRKIDKSQVYMDSLTSSIGKIVAIGNNKKGFRSDGLFKIFEYFREHKRLQYLKFKRQRRLKYKKFYRKHNNKKYNNYEKSHKYKKGKQYNPR